MGKGGLMVMIILLVLLLVGVYQFEISSKKNDIETLKELNEIKQKKINTMISDRRYNEQKI